ncbi:hypothetical protein Poly51_31440 [Rubripirellula tenax]|uniref:Formyltransferase/hydrolase complex Fhc subunit B n=1 Tax=Rubripirellula tenax TaxID=2528015 RepID=A0A5C6F048_9BACT|nr:hypothetical protein [Rubripirellula tenax]TWU54425.1 hypothetical protein Poly51_31440 [Rubripirellula tenax]
MNPLAIVCPFCPLHCDDLLVDKDGELNVACSIASQAFAAAVEPNPIAREAVMPPPSGVVRLAASQVSLSEARDLAGLLRTGRIELTVDETPTQAALRAAIARDGNISATLGDVRKHANVVWSVGDCTASMPRIWERVGCDPVIVDAIGANELADLVYEIDSGATQVDTLGNALKSAKYLAVIVSPSAFRSGEETVTAELLVRAVLRWNQASRRAVLVSLDPAAMLRSVAGWHTNLRLPRTTGPVDVRMGTPITGAYPAELQIGGIDPGTPLAASYVPAAVAGVHFADAIIRGDATVTLPLDKITAGVNERRSGREILDACGLFGMNEK